ncbi:MAG: hypothetical protein GX230_11470 [Lentisphaerae bacterium]|jgi:hypothetical protein|nr:hypothetical protein [Lentisphaerota bacterium]
MRFFITYLLFAAAGTIVVHFTAPKFAPKAANWARQLAVKESAEPVEVSQHVAVRNMPAPATATTSIRPRSVAEYGTGGAQIDQQVPVATPPQAVVAVTDITNSDASDIDVTFSIDASDEKKSEEPVEAERAEVRELYRPPEGDPEAPFWGVLVQSAPSSGLDGNNLGRLPAGIVAEIQEIKTTAKGDVAVCIIDDNGRWRGPIVIGLEYLLRFEGPLTAAPAEPLDLLHRYYTLKGRADERLAEIKRRTTPVNPHEAEYQKAVSALKAFDQRVSAMVKERDTASGARRAKLIDELHAAKYEINRLKHAVEEAGGKRNNWARQNPPPKELPVDPTLAAWQAELAKLEPEIKRYVD